MLPITTRYLYKQKLRTGSTWGWVSVFFSDSGCVFPPTFATACKRISKSFWHERNGKRNATGTTTAKTGGIYGKAYEPAQLGNIGLDAKLEQMKQRNRKHGLTQLVSQVREYLVTPPQFSVDEIMRGTNDEARRLNAATTDGWICPYCDYTQTWAMEPPSREVFDQSRKTMRELCGVAQNLV